jgi:hypothetical protein
MSRRRQNRLGASGDYTSTSARWKLCGKPTLTIGGHCVGHYSAQAELLTPLTKKQAKAVEKTHGAKVKKPTFTPRLQIPQKTRDSHFTTATTTTN